MSELAIRGGVPVRTKPLPYGRQSIDDGDIEAVLDVLRSDWLTTGPNVSAFEEAFAVQVRAKHAIAVSSGTAALHAAVFACGIGPGDEVIVPPLTFAASANCVLYQGGTVVFADVRPDTLNLHPKCVEAAITPRTKAILPVDYAGQVCDFDEIRDIAAKNHLMIIEDACHALGGTYRGQPVGGLANLTVFSLHPVKHITTGEGGMITTNDDALAERMRRFRNHGISSDHHQRAARGSCFYEMVDLGYNYRLTDFQSALGRRQLQKLSSWLARRREIAARYTDAFSALPELEPPFVLPDRESAWHLYVLRLNLERLRVNRDEVIRALHAENIRANVHYIPVPWHPYYQRLGYAIGSWPVAENMYYRIVTLPLFPAMTDRDVNDVIAAVKKVLGAFVR